MIPIDKDEVGSFTIDHTKLKPGIYVAREGDVFTTFDVRMTAPNREPAMSPGGYHSLEHLIATYVRNSYWKNDVIACDAMACLTGFYLIMKTTKHKYSPLDIRKIMIDCMTWILDVKEVPATTPATCGNYNLHNLEDAKYYASKFRHALQTDFHSEYVKLDVTLANGMKFADA